ncbi:MAG TPA: choice-of-anchor D domain-containing protein [Casimicrobiaceae bacterium]|jgi:hypothetical protein
MTLAWAGVQGSHVRSFIALAAIVLCAATTGASAQDAANGKKLYLGQPSASFAGGSAGCNTCHNVNDTTNPMNVLFRGAANDAGLIDFAINTNPDSAPDMRPLFGPVGLYPLSADDEADIAAYIDSVVNPGGGGPVFAASPASKNFGTVAVGTQSAVTTFTIAVSGASGTLSSVASSNNAEFLLAGGTCLATPANVAQNASCTVDVVFAPGVAGARAGTLSIIGNGTPNPLTIALSGTGGASAPPQGNLAGPGPVAFAAQALFTQSAPKTLTLRNAGSLAVSVTALASSNPSEFPLLSSTCGIVAPGATCTASIAFAPAAAGARTATLAVTNDGVTNPLVIALSGTGTGGTSSGGTKVTVYEYYNATLNHYFITSNAGEIQLLGKPPFEAWQPTGLSFAAWAPSAAPAGTVGVCRFFNDHFLGVSTHFYAPHGLGCESTISQFPDWTLEDPQLFYASLPDIAGNCSSGNVPVYRLFNNGMGGAPNHRFTTDPTVRQQMIAKGYAPEGYGIGVGWCAPQ